MNNELKIMCVYCHELQSAEVKAEYDVTLDCDSCGSTGELGVQVLCAVCKHPLYYDKKESYLWEEPIEDVKR